MVRVCERAGAERAKGSGVRERAIREACVLGLLRSQSGSEGSSKRE
jgi:hypothetical protein